jgi:hypothetical protein
VCSAPRLVENRTLRSLAYLINFLLGNTGAVLNPTLAALDRRLFRLVYSGNNDANQHEQNDQGED